MLRKLTLIIGILTLASLVATACSPAPTPAPGRPYVTADTRVNIRSGPDTGYANLDYMAEGLSGEVVGVNSERTWWAIKYPPGSDGKGWVAAQHVTDFNTSNVPVIQPSSGPQPTQAPPIEFSGWRGEYFDNRDLQGDPVLVRDDAKIDFDWRKGSPDPKVPNDNFSARWTISRELPAGTYRFSAWADDGVRMWVDDRLIIDDWREVGARNVVADVNLIRGTHTARVEYFEGTGSALIKLEVSYPDEYAEWKAEYFDNPNVQEPPVVLRDEVDINYNWGPNPPAPGVPADDFSARWSRRVSVPEAGNYLVRADVAGGVRLWLDGVLLIDSWASEGPRGLEAETGNIKRGNHDLRVDYFKATGNGQIRVSATRLGSDGPPKAGIDGATGAGVGQPVAFNARGSSVAPGSHITTFAWEFGDGTGASGVDVVHIYTQPGSYEVKLTVTDDKGRSDTATQGIKISGQPAPPEGPTAVIVALDETKPGLDVAFDASQSQGPNPIVSYAWDFGDGTTANAVIAHKVYNGIGLFNVILVVTDDQGLESRANHQINVMPEAVQPLPTVEPEPTAPPEAVLPTVEPEPQPPTAVISVSQDGVTELPIAGPVPIPGGQPVYFLGTASVPGSSPIAGYQWDFGSGQVGQGEVVTHTFSVSGVYTVSLTVADEDGQTGTALQQVQVQ